VFVSLARSLAAATRRGIIYNYCRQTDNQPRHSSFSFAAASIYLPTNQPTNQSISPAAPRSCCTFSLFFIHIRLSWTVSLSSFILPAAPIDRSPLTWNIIVWVKCRKPSWLSTHAARLWYITRQQRRKGGGRDRPDTGPTARAHGRGSGREEFRRVVGRRRDVEVRLPVGASSTAGRRS